MDMPLLLRINYGISHDVDWEAHANHARAQIQKGALKLKKEFETCLTGVWWKVESVEQGRELAAADSKCSDYFIEECPSEDPYDRNFDNGGDVLRNVLDRGHVVEYLVPYSKMSEQDKLRVLDGYKFIETFKDRPVAEGCPVVRKYSIVYKLVSPGVIQGSGGMAQPDFVPRSWVIDEKRTILNRAGENITPTRLFFAREMALIKEDFEAGLYEKLKAKWPKALDDKSGLIISDDDLNLDV
jgi:hypothetical protein